MSSIEMPSRQVLEEAPARALQFLRGAGTSIAVHAILAANGFTEAEHALGWQLIHKACNYGTGPDGAAIDYRVRDAITECDAWDEPGVSRIDACLGRLHPAQRDFVLDGVAPATGAASVLVVATVLDRLDALENSPAREATRDADRAALATLAARRLDKAERERLRAVVTVAQGAPQSSADLRAIDEQRTQDLYALYLWYHDWAVTARTLIKRRDHLIGLGLAKRKQKDRGAPDAPPA
jgi:hypothetical protein